MRGRGAPSTTLRLVAPTPVQRRASLSAVWHSLPTPPVLAAACAPPRRGDAARCGGAFAVVGSRPVRPLVPSTFARGWTILPAELRPCAASNSAAADTIWSACVLTFRRRGCRQRLLRLRLPDGRVRPLSHVDGAIARRDALLSPALLDGNACPLSHVVGAPGRCDTSFPVMPLSVGAPCNSLLFACADAPRQSSLRRWRLANVAARISVCLSTEFTDGVALRQVLWSSSRLLRCSFSDRILLRWRESPMSSSALISP